MVSDAVDPNFPPRVTEALVLALRELYPPIYATRGVSPEDLLRRAGAGEVIDFLEYQYRIQNNLDPEE